MNLSGRPMLQSAKIIAYHSKLCGHHPALLDGPCDAKGEGVAFEVESAETCQTSAELWDRALQKSRLSNLADGWLNGQRSDVYVAFKYWRAARGSVWFEGFSDETVGDGLSRRASIKRGPVLIMKVLLARSTKSCYILVDSAYSVDISFRVLVQRRLMWAVSITIF